MAESATKGIEYDWVVCGECGGRGYFSVPDNGTNNGEEDCLSCFGEGRRFENEWGETPDD